MFLGALLAAGLPLDALQEALQKLEVGGYRLQVTDDLTHDIRATSVHVEITEGHSHRTWKDIQKIITNSSLSLTIKEKSLAVFETLAGAEAHVHGCAVDNVHFHEVGGVDAIVDIVGTVFGLEYLHISELITSPLPMPGGFVKCAHGMLPLPAPAVCEILKQVPVYGVPYNLEMVTPTGAAIVKTLSSNFGPFPTMSILHNGYGAGSHRFPDGRPNLLRLVLGETKETAEEQVVEVVETNLDDWSPESFPHLCDKLFKAGALDVSLVPIQMKKGRPGFLLRTIAAPAFAWEIKRCILTETTAIGLRYRQEQRWTLPREEATIDTIWGPLQVKKVQTPAGIRLYPEYEACRRMADDYGVPLKDVYAAVAGFKTDSFK